MSTESSAASIMPPPSGSHSSAIVESEMRAGMSPVEEATLKPAIASPVGRQIMQ